MFSKSWLFLLFLLAICPKYVMAQGSEKEYGVYFAWEVKQVDEFIERFNNDKSAFINEYLKKNNSAPRLTRERMIKSLFNAKGSDWNYQQITDFIKQVNNASSPQYLDFKGENWFAKVNCRATYNGQSCTAVLILKVVNFPDGSSKWVIVDMKFADKSRVAFSNKDASALLPCPNPIDPSVSLDPMSHATGFMNIDLVTQRPENIGNFVIDSGDRSKNLNLFIDACLKNNLKIIQVANISYSFLQIKGWRIEVKQFTRHSLNSGWLISKLVKVS